MRYVPAFLDVYYSGTHQILELRPVEKRQSERVNVREFRDAALLISTSISPVLGGKNLVIRTPQNQSFNTRRLDLGDGIQRFETSGFDELYYSFLPTFPTGVKATDLVMSETNPRKGVL